MKKKTKIESVADEVVVDSRDVDRATEIAVKRKKAIVEDELVDGHVVDEEVLTSPEHRK